MLGLRLTRSSRPCGAHDDGVGSHWHLLSCRSNPHEQMLILAHWWPVHEPIPNRRQNTCSCHWACGFLAARACAVTYHASTTRVTHRVKKHASNFGLNCGRDVCSCGAWKSFMTLLSLRQRIPGWSQGRGFGSTRKKEKVKGTLKRKYCAILCFWQQVRVFVVAMMGKEIRAY
jgi:hypothetical protein